MTSAKAQIHHEHVRTLFPCVLINLALPVFDICCSAIPCLSQNSIVPLAATARKYWYLARRMGQWMRWSYARGALASAQGKCFLQIIPTIGSLHSVLRHPFAEIFIPYERMLVSFLQCGFSLLEGFEFQDDFHRCKVADEGLEWIRTRDRVRNIQAGRQRPAGECSKGVYICACCSGPAARRNYYQLLRTAFWALEKTKTKPLRVIDI